MVAPADALSTLLRTNAPGDPVLPARAARAFARIIGFPWLAATGDDFRFATTRGRRPPGLRFTHAYLDRLFSASGRDARVWLQVARVLQFSDSPLSLYGPRMLWAALRQPRPRALIGPVALPLALASAVGQAPVHYPREHAVPRD